MWTSPPLSCCTGWRTAPTACSVITAPISASPSCPWDTEDASGVTLTQGTLDNALRTAALYALIPGIAEEEGVTLSQDFQDTFADQLATMTEAMGGEDVMAMYLWQYPLNS